MPSYLTDHNFTLSDFENLVLVVIQHLQIRSYSTDQVMPFTNSISKSQEHDRTEIPSPEGTLTAVYPF
jgi:hypothetical protein